MKNKIAQWLANIFYYGLFLSTMLIVTWLMLRPYEGVLWDAFSRGSFPKKDFVFDLFFLLYFLASTVLLLYWGWVKKLSITMNEFVWGFVLWLIAIVLILVIASKAFSSF